MLDVQDCGQRDRWQVAEGQGQGAQGQGGCQLGGWGLRGSARRAVRHRASGQETAWLAARRQGMRATSEGQEAKGEGGGGQGALGRAYGAKGSAQGAWRGWQVLGAWLLKNAGSKGGKEWLRGRWAGA